MHDSRKIIAFCGSSKFKEVFLAVAKGFALRGYVVIPPIIYSHTDGVQFSAEEEHMLEAENIVKMSIADVIVLINPNDYVGEGMIRETRAIKSIENKEIYVLEDGEHIRSLLQSVNITKFKVIDR